jgi:hypothetical protein
MHLARTIIDCKVQVLTWILHSQWAGQGRPWLYRTQRFITVFTQPRQQVMSSILQIGVVILAMYTVPRKFIQCLSIFSMVWILSFLLSVGTVYQYSVWLRIGRPGDRGSIPGRVKGIFSSNLCVQTRSGTHPASCSMGTGGPFPGGKVRPGRDADHSPHLVARSRMSRSCTSSPPSASMACRGTALLTFTVCKSYGISIPI